MKAKELMIGDWVYEDGIAQIVEDLSKSDGINGYGEDIYSPIPLTEEILKANDWVVMGQSIWMVRCLYELSDTQRVRIYLHYPYMLQYVDDERTDGYEVREWGIGNIAYVHELQHALRLCGLNDLADNFKLNEE